MKLPFNDWLTILEYRDFYDLPRLVLASASRTSFWIFDSSFVDAEDDYSSEYSVYFAGSEIEEAKNRFEQHAKYGSLPNGIDLNDRLLMRLPLSKVQFDASKRKSLLIND